MGVMIDGCIWNYENMRFLPQHPENPDPCGDISSKGLCKEVQAIHHMSLGTGCGADNLSMGVAFGTIPIREDTMQPSAVARTSHVSWGKEAIEAFHEWFQEIDSDRNGFVTWSEWSANIDVVRGGLQSL